MENDGAVEADSNKEFYNDEIHKRDFSNDNPIQDCWTQKDSHRLPSIGAIYMDFGNYGFVSLRLALDEGSDDDVEDGWDDDECDQKAAIKNIQAISETHIKRLMNVCDLLSYERREKEMLCIYCHGCRE